MSSTNESPTSMSSLIPSNSPDKPAPDIFERIPLEILFHVASYLDPPALLKLAQTRKEYSETILGLLYEHDVRSKSYRALPWVCEKGSLAALKLCVERGNDVDHVFGEWEWSSELTPLLVTILYKDLEKVHYLLDQGADITKPSPEPAPEEVVYTWGAAKTPLQWMVSNWSYYVVREKVTAPECCAVLEELLKRGADPNAVANGQLPFPLHRALDGIVQCPTEAVHLLLQYGAKALWNDIKEPSDPAWANDLVDIIKSVLRNQPYHTPFLEKLAVVLDCYPEALSWGAWNRVLELTLENPGCVAVELLRLALTPGRNLDAILQNVPEWMVDLDWNQGQHPVRKMARFMSTHDFSNFDIDERSSDVSKHAVDMFRLLLEAGLGIDEHTLQCTLMQLIVDFNSVSDEKQKYLAAAAAVLLQHGADPNKPSWPGERPPLHKACIWARSNRELIRVLLERGADPNARDFRQHTPLYYVCYFKFPNKHILKYLLPHVADLNAKEDGLTPLQWLERSNYQLAEKMRGLFLAPGESSQKDSEIQGPCPLVQKMLPELMHRVVDFLQVKDIYRLALCLKAYNEILVTRLYIEDIQSGDYRALPWACVTGSIATLKLCLTLGKSAECPELSNSVDHTFQPRYEGDTREGLTPLLVAISHNHLEFVRYLLHEAKADVEKLSPISPIDHHALSPPLQYQIGWSKTPLQWALHVFPDLQRLRDQHFDILEELLKNGANPNFTDLPVSNGYHSATPLYLALTLAECPLGAVCLLLRFGAQELGFRKSKPGDPVWRGYLLELITNGLQYEWPCMAILPEKLTVILAYYPEALSCECWTKILETILATPSPHSVVMLRYVLAHGCSGDTTITRETGGNWHWPSYSAARYLVAHMTDVDLDPRFGEHKEQVLNMFRLLLESNAQGSKAQYEEMLARIGGGVRPGDPDAQYQLLSAAATLLVQQGADPNATDGPNAETRPLHRACLRSHGNQELIRTLLRLGAEVNDRDSQGMTPLHWACRAPSFDEATVQCLVQHGADVRVRSADGCTPLQYLEALVGKREISEDLRGLLMTGLESSGPEGERGPAKRCLRPHVPSYMPRFK